MLPPIFSAVSERFGTPYRTTLVTGVVVAALTFFFPLKTLAELVNIGTLFAFVLVSIGVIVMRRTRPDLERPFRTPLVPVLPIASVLASLWLMLNSPRRGCASAHGCSSDSWSTSRTRCATASSRVGAG
jgi:APA family basic amino acid/polyamine antiporter